MGQSGSPSDVCRNSAVYFDVYFGEFVNSMQLLHGFVTSTRDDETTPAWQALFVLIRSEIIMLKQKTVEQVSSMRMAISLSEVEEEGLPGKYKICNPFQKLLELLQERKLVQKRELSEARLSSRPAGI
jgi:hypothetical protein